MRLSPEPAPQLRALEEPAHQDGQRATDHGVDDADSTRLLQTCESLVNEYASVERAIGIVAKYV